MKLTGGFSLKSTIQPDIFARDFRTKKFWGENGEWSEVTFIPQIGNISVIRLKRFN